MSHEYPLLGQARAAVGPSSTLAPDSPLPADSACRVWFDFAKQRLAQTNPGLARPPDGSAVIGLFEQDPPVEYSLEQPLAGGPITCTERPVPDARCSNGSLVCPPTFGNWGQIGTAFTSILGVFYLNTSLLPGASTPFVDLWQWSWTLPTLMPNGTYINVTRNYTYHVGRRPDALGRRPLLRYTQTQSIPLRPASPIHRDCFIFDYRTNYTFGPPSDARFKPPAGVTCRPGHKSGQRLGLLPWTQRTDPPTTRY